MPTQGTVTGTLASTKDPHQNVESPSEQVRRREKHAAAALKRREQNLSQQRDPEFCEMIDVVRATHRSEIDQLQADRQPDAEETVTLLRATAVPQLAQVDVEGIEVTLAAPDPFDAANASASCKDKVETLIEGICQQLPKEQFCQILFELVKPDTEANQKAEHPIGAIHWLV